MDSGEGLGTNSGWVRTSSTSLAVWMDPFRKARWSYAAKETLTNRHLRSSRGIRWPILVSPRLYLPVLSLLLSSPQLFACL